MRTTLIGNIVWWDWQSLTDGARWIVFIVSWLIVTLFFRYIDRRKK